MQAAYAALEHAGFSVTHYEDLASRADRIPWYSPLERAISDANAHWDSDENALCPLFGGLSKDGATVIVQAAKWKVRIMSARAALYLLRV